MRAALRWMMLATALSGPAIAQTKPAGPSEADQALLAAFGKAFTITSRAFIVAVPARTLIAHALDGLASAPMLGSAEQKRAVAAGLAKVTAAPTDDTSGLLRSFGGVLDALRATPGHPPLDAILRAATAGMLSGLDTRTRFLPPAPPQQAGANIGGAGLAIAAGPDGFRVVRAYPHDPAAQAGIQRGDRLVSIDGHPTKDLPIEAVATLLRGPVGSASTLLVRRGQSAAPIAVTLTRAVIRIPLVYGRNIGQVGFIQLGSFAPGVAEGVRRLFAELQNHAAAPLTGVVLDLRDNSGGRLTEAVETASEWLPPGTPIASTTGRQPADAQRFTASTGDIAAGLPMVVLVNEDTAAGSEIVAEALEKGRGAVIMGSHTAGAGLVATVVPLSPLGAMSLTTGQLVLASGQMLQPPGILPQVALKPEPGAAALEDPATDPAIVRLRRGLAQTPEAGEPFDAPDTPERDFEVKQACAALAMLAPAAAR